MADINYDDYGTGMSDGQASRGPGQAILNICGAVLSLGLLLGLVYWGYSIAMRDVTGIPVLRAMSEPMRISPVDPGGESTSHQGLTVNAVAAVGAVAEMPNQLILAPEPIALTEEDAPGLGGIVSGQAALLANSEVIADPAVDTALETTGLLEPVEVAVAEVVPLDPAQSDAVALALAAALAEEDPALAGDGTGLLTSPRPKARRQSNGEGEVVAMAEPNDLMTLSADAGNRAAIKETLSAEIPVGTRLVQLGAFDDGEAARREWLRLSGQFGDLMSDKSMVVQEAKSGGRAFFRLRAHGFEDEDQARRFCAAILAEGASCIPVAQR